MRHPDRVWGEADFDGDGELADDWLVLALIDAFYGAEDAEDVGGFFVFSDWLFCGVVVLLVRQEDVVEEGAFRGEERAG